MADGTERTGDVADTAVVYDAGERRTHAEHAAEAYDLAQRADALIQMRDAAEMPEAAGRYELAAAVADNRAQWHAQMATYHAIVDR